MDGGDEVDVGERQQRDGKLRDTDGAEHVAEQIVQVAQLLARRALGILRGLAAARVPELVRERRLLREQDRADEQDAGDYLARHSSRPARKMSFGSFLPMNTITERFFSDFAQGLPRSPPIIMCTPWNTTRSFLPFIQSTPL